MTKEIEFYYDFISPYSYIAYKRIIEIEKNSKIRFNFKPILLGGLHNLHGIKAPAFIPSKARFMIRDCKMIAEKNNFKFKFNSYFPIKTTNLMRGVFIAEEDNFKNFYIDKMFSAIWGDGLNMNDQNIIDIDGLKIIWKNEWVHIRKSNTEPILRIISESQSKNRSIELIETIKGLI